MLDSVRPPMKFEQDEPDKKTIKPATKEDKKAYLGCIAFIILTALAIALWRLAWNVDKLIK